jgi:hypothetical protein
MIDQQTRDAINRAADFFAANPSKRTVETLAKDALGNRVSPTNSFAVCWCALGRIAKELDIGFEGDDSEPVYIKLTERGLDNASIYEANDDPEATTDDVVLMLKDLADA